jgi:hypothetical protein
MAPAAMFTCTAPFLVRIINLSLEEGEVPASMKYAIITSLLEASLDKNELLVHGESIVNH